MLIYIITFAANMLIGKILVPNWGYHENLDSYQQRQFNKRKIIYLILTTLQLGLLCGFRSTEMAYDTEAYELLFNRTPDSWENIFDNKQYIELGFSIYCSVIKIMGGSFQTILIISSLFIIGSCCIFIYQHSKNVVLSVFIIISFPFFYSTFDILRHFLAISFLLLGYKYVNQKKFFRFLIFIAIGSLFHTISWIFLSFYFIKNIKYNFFTLIIAVAGTVFSFLYMDEIALVLSSALDKNADTDWINSYGGGLRTAVMYLVVFLIALILYYNMKTKTTYDTTALNFTLILLLFAIIFINARIMTRFIMTAIPFLAISIPQLLDYNRLLDKKTYQLCYLGFLFIGIVYHAFMLITNWQNVVPYIPYWD